MTCEGQACPCPSHPSPEDGSLFEAAPARINWFQEGSKMDATEPQRETKRNGASPSDHRSLAAPAAPAGCHSRHGPIMPRADRVCWGSMRSRVVRSRFDAQSRCPVGLSDLRALHGALLQMALREASKRTKLASGHGTSLRPLILRERHESAKCPCGKGHASARAVPSPRRGHEQT